MHGHKIIYAPINLTAPCTMLFGQVHYEGCWALELEIFVGKIARAVRRVPFGAQKY